MNINIRSSEARILMEAVEGWLEHGPLKAEDPEFSILCVLSNKLNEALNIDRWKPLSQLPPLGMKVMMREVGSNRQFLAIREVYASSYAPTEIEMVIDGSNRFLNTRDYHWTNDYA